jgi:16S rRNA (uracil1498-N3)-methyltransferase
MSERFFSSQPISGDRADLTGDEARHLSAVMRAKIGDEVVLFDGSGAEFTATITAIRKHVVELTIIERREISRELPFSVTLAVALPKGDRQKWLVEKATELGVTRIVPLTTERGVAQPLDSALDRLRRSVIEASKQCGRNRLLEIATPADAIAYFAAAPPSATRLLADPTGQPLATTLLSRNQEIITAIGPEGGFSPAELSAAHSAGWLSVSLGNRILRVETAAIALASWAVTAYSPE